MPQRDLNACVFQIRDWYNDNSYHINNTLKWNAGGAKWTYGTARDYEWAGGTHLFFSWLEAPRQPRRPQ